MTETDRKLCKERTERVVLMLVLRVICCVSDPHPFTRPLRSGWNTRPKRNVSIVLCCLPFSLFYSTRCRSSVRWLLISSNCFRAAWFSFSLKITHNSLSYVLHLLCMSYAGPFFFFACLVCLAI